MRFTRLLVVPAIAAAVIPDIIDPYIPRVGHFATFGVYGPFTNEENVAITFGYDALSSNIRGILRAYNNTNNAFLYQSSISFSGLFSNEVELEVKNRIKNYDLRIEVEFEKNGNNLFDGTWVLSRNSPKTIIINNNQYEYSNICFGIINDEVVNNETYDFSETNGYYSSNGSGSIDFSEFNFLYTPINNYHCDNAYLEIVDYQNIYRNVAKNSDGKTFQIPLEIKQKKSVVSFVTKSNMYVNNTSLDMSSVELSGYASTDNFYIPNGREYDFERNESKIVIEGSGFNKDTVIIPVSFFFLNKHFGSCNHSDVCVNGGVKE